MNTEEIRKYLTDLDIKVFYVFDSSGAFVRDFSPELFNEACPWEQRAWQRIVCRNRKDGESFYIVPRDASKLICLTDLTLAQISALKNSEAIPQSVVQISKNPTRYECCLKLLGGGHREMSAVSVAMGIQNRFGGTRTCLMTPPGLIVSCDKRTFATRQVFSSSNRLPPGIGYWFASSGCVGQPPQIERKKEFAPYALNYRLMRAQLIGRGILDEKEIDLAFSKELTRRCVPKVTRFNLLDWLSHHHSKTKKERIAYLRTFFQAGEQAKPTL